MADAEPPLLTISGASAGYGRTPSIADIGFTLDRGDFVAIVGANGSGKSTLLRALSGQIPLMAGTITIAGHDLVRAPEAAKGQFGYAVDPADLPADLTGAQYIEMIASIRGCTASTWPVDLVETLQFGPWLPRTIETYSLGTRMKLSIMGALLGAPPLLLLDESLNGLDPLILARTRRLLADLCAAGHGIIMSTHMLGTIGAGCTAILMIEQGRITHRWTAPMIAAAEGGIEAMILASLDSAQTAARGSNRANRSNR